jgi:anti-sigma B factor antagonist
MSAADSQIDPPLTLEVEHRDDVAVMRLGGDLDIVSAPVFRAALQEAVETGPGSVVVDLSGLQFIDSSGLGSLVAIRRNLLSAGGLLVCVVTPQSRTADLLRLTGLDRVLALAATVDEAVRLVCERDL